MAYQHLTYVPVVVRTRWEIWIDWVLPPILTPAGMRFDDDYYERFLFHVLRIGGPDSDYNHSLTMWDRILDARDALILRWQAFSAKWQERGKKVSGWFKSCFGLRKAEESAVAADVEEVDRDGEGPLLPEHNVVHERTALLSQTRQIPSSLSLPISTYSSSYYTIPPATPSPSSPRPALSSNPKYGGNRTFMKKFKVWRYKSKTVRFNSEDDEFVFHRPAWEPRGCHRVCPFLLLSQK